MAQIDQLKRDFGLIIGYALFTHRNRRLECDYDRKTRLCELRKELKVDSVKNSRNTRTDVATRQAVVDIKQNDVAGGWGVTQVKGRLANKGVLIPRYDVMIPE